MNDEADPSELLQAILSKVGELEATIQRISTQLDTVEENQRKLEKRVEEAESAIISTVNSYSDSCRYYG